MNLSRFLAVLALLLLVGAARFTQAAAPARAMREQPAVALATRPLATRPLRQPLPFRATPRDAHRMPRTAARFTRRPGSTRKAPLRLLAVLLRRSVSRELPK